MRTYLEVVGASINTTLDLEGSRLTVGKADGNDLVVDDPAVSRVHLLVESAGPGWMVNDAGSRNGTYFNGDRLLGPKVLRPGDELMIGSTRLVFRTAGATPAQMNETGLATPPPELTPRETTALVALARPVLESNILAEPASVRELAEVLVVTESAIKKLLGRLYDKFDLHDADRRRGRLVAEAISRGAVSRNSLKSG